MTLLQHFGMFILGLKDSISIQWIKRLLLYVDPKTKKVHPSSKVLFDSLKLSFIKIFLYTIIVPQILEYVFSFFRIIPLSGLLKLIYLILTYGYLFFYNNDIIVSTKKLVTWQQKKQPGANFEIDKAQNIEFWTLISGQVKSFVFLLFYYLPIYLLQTQVLGMIPYFGKIFFILSESFFNGVFYFMKTWPFDKYNIGFMEKNMSYLIGYGFTVSLVCNYFLSGSFSIGVYLIISLWMLINTVIYSPPVVVFKSISDILKYTSKNQRKMLANAYNEHRRKIRSSQLNRDEIASKIFLVYPALKITSILNKKIQKWINASSSIQQNPDQSRKILQNQDISMNSSIQTFESIAKVSEDKEQSSNIITNQQTVKEFQIN